MRPGLQSFKLFLDELLHPEHDPERLSLLKAYLEAVKPSADDENPVFLPDIMQLWSHAAQTNNENIMSAVPVVLDLLLRLLSNTPDTVPYGLGICRTLLQKRQQELIARNLSADKSKSFIISPTLRVLKEAIAFDGGAIARSLFRARTNMLKSLARNMGIVHIGDEPEDAKRPSARTNAILFFLSALRFLHAEAKKELLSQRDIVSALTRDIKQDPPYLVKDILDGLKVYVLLDDKLPREAKSALLNASTLTRLSTLYQYRLDSPEEDETSIADIAHEFLMLACTNPSCGVLRQDSGYYPREVDLNVAISAAEIDNLGLEAIVWTNKFKAEVPVRNYTLSNFLPNLRPWSSVKQSELITAIFKVAPELVANYFLNNKSFSFEPKLSATWIGYAAFLFNTVALPIPAHFCRGSNFASLPPPTSIVLDNILPPPLNQKALTRCLNHKSNLISFFGVRILVVAIEKLDQAIKLYHESSHTNKTAWTEAAKRLVDEFCQRSPSIKDMINAYRSIPEADLMRREAASRLLRLCYEVLPQMALMAKFDVSPLLETCLRRLSSQELDDPRDFALSLKELENLLAIAGYSPGMRWLVTSEGLSLSPFTMLLKVCVEAPHGVALEAIRQVLGFVAKEQQLVPASDHHPGLLVLLEALRALDAEEPESVVQVWPFLDNCLTRCANAPVRYVEKLQQILSEEAKTLGEGLSEAVVSPLAIVMLEQLPFVAAKKDEQDKLRALGKFLPKFLGYSVTAGESKPALDLIFCKMAEYLADSKNKAEKSGVPGGLAFTYSDWSRHAKTSVCAQKSDKKPISSSEQDQGRKAIDLETLAAMLDVADTLKADNSALTKWMSKTVDELVDEGYLTALVSLLVSEHASIRKEALVNILKAATKIKQSEYEEKEQVWVLLSELAETARDKVNDGPLPSTTVSFACHALNVLRDPLSQLYPKVNTFLIRGPSWNLDKPPLVTEILSEDPAIGDSWYAQSGWLLEYLLDGLRTPSDFELFHKKRLKGPLFERILALAANPYLRAPLRMQLCRLIYRTTKIEGGSTTLITRLGIMSWLEAREADCLDPSEAVIYAGLRERIWDTCDQARVKSWSKSGLGHKV